MTGCSEHIFMFGKNRCSFEILITEVMCYYSINFMILPAAIYYGDIFP